MIPQLFISAQFQRFAALIVHMCTATAHALGHS